MTNNFIIAIFILIAISTFGLGYCLESVDTTKAGNQLICKQLYQKRYQCLYKLQYEINKRKY